MTLALTPAPAPAEPGFAPCIRPRGPRSRLMILGEAPGAQEQALGLPFVGPSGQELERMLREAGLQSRDLFLTNVFHTRPPGNDIETFFLPANQAKSSPYPPIRINNKVRLLHPAMAPEWDRLEAEIAECRPNLILALGNTALWRLTGRTSIGSVRGTTFGSTATATVLKLLPTYHPAAVLRQWDLRPIVISDLMKAKIQAEYPEIRRPARSVTINPTLGDIESLLARLGTAGRSAGLLACDIETRQGQITEIAFALSRSEALVVPFIRGFNGHYWPTPGDEASALRLVKAILQSGVPKVFQNGLYDIQWIWRCWHFAPRNCVHDTMLRHHSELPELPKGLGFLGSIYTSEPAWKLMRRRGETQEKRDDE